jgi:alpha-tubulin suppressor-like RCC1 family protein
LTLPPVALPGAVTAAFGIAAGDAHTCAILADGALTCWGSDDFGQLGNGTTSGDVVAPPLPVSLPGVAGASAVSAGDAHTCVRLSTGRVSCWGSDAQGQLGDGAPSADRDEPSGTITMPGGAAVDSISSGAAFSCALLAGGTVACWGDDSVGQLGNGPTSSSVDAPGRNVWFRDCDG